MADPTTTATDKKLQLPSGAINPQTGGLVINIGAEPNVPVGTKTQAGVSGQPETGAPIQATDQAAAPANPAEATPPQMPTEEVMGAAKSRIDANLQQDQADEQRQLDDHDHALQGMAVENDRLDPDVQQLVDDYRSQNGQQDIGNPSWISKALDVPAQATNGFVDAANSIKDLVFDMGAAGSQVLYADALGMATPGEVKTAADQVKGAVGKDIPKPFGAPKSVAGAIAEPVAQFLAPFSVLGKLKYLQALGKAAPLVQGALTDFVAFDEHQQRLSNMVNNVGWGNAVTDYLASKPGDSWAEGRFKNALEGAGLGAFTEGMFHGVRYIKDGRVARQAVQQMRAAAGPRTQAIRAAAASVDNLKQYVNATLRGKEAPEAARAAAATNVTPPVAPAARTVNPTTVTPGDRDTAIRTIFGEASNQGKDGWQAVANVLLNRQQAGKYGATLDAIAKKKNQFEPWGNATARQRMEGLSPDSPEYQQIGKVFDQVAAGQLPDNTGGATHFLQKNLQEQLGRKIPAWAKNPLAQVGDHTFFSPDGPVSGRVAQAAQAPAAANTLGGFRPNKEAIDLATQRRTAAANGTTLDDLTSAKVFQKIRDLGLQNQLNKVTLLEEQQFNTSAQAAQEYLQRADIGDSTAGDEFWRNEGAAFLEVAGHARDAFQDVARAQGFRGNSPEVVTTNEMLRRLAGASTQSKEDLLRTFAALSNPDQVDVLMQNLGKKGAGKIINDVIKEWYTNGLLANPTTQMVDVAGSVLWTPWLALEKLPAATIGKIRAGWMGGATDRVYANEAAIMFKSYMGSIADGFSLLGKSLKSPDLHGALDALHGRDVGAAVKAAAPVDIDALHQSFLDHRIDTSTRFDENNGYGRAITADNVGLERDTQMGRLVDWAGTMVNIPATFMRSKDDVVKSILYRAEVRALAHRRAMGEGLEGEAYNARVNALTAVPLDKAELANQSLTGSRLVQLANSLKLGDDAPLIGANIEEQARNFARQGTFTNDLGPVAQAFKEGLDKIPGGWIIAPFVKTPVNIMVSFLKRTPFAPVYQSVRDDLAAGGARADMAMGRMAAGSALMTYAWHLAAAGIITGDGPKDPAEKAALLRTGWRSRSIHLGNHYVSYARFDPIASFFLLPANFVDLHDQLGEDMGAQDKKDAGDYFAMGALAFANLLKGKTWTQQLGQILDAVNNQDEHAVQKTMQNIVASIAVPSGVSFFANNINPIQQDSQSMWEAIQARAGKTVRPQKDVWGEVIKRDPQFYYGLPASYSNITTDPLEQQLVGDGVFVPKPGRTIQGVQLTPDEYSDMMDTMKKLDVKGAMRKLTQSSVYQQLPDSIKSGEEGAQSMTKSGVALSLYGTFLKGAQKMTVQKNAALQQRILRFKNALQTQPATTPAAARAMGAQGAAGFSATGGPIRFNPGLGAGQ